MNILPRVFLTLGVGLCGAVVAFQLAWPAPALIGSALAVSALALLGQPMQTAPFLRKFAFTAIGCSLGSGFTPEFFSLAALWPLSLVGLTLILALIMFSSGWILTRLFGHSRSTALLASSPGGLSLAIALAASGIGDARAVSILQSLRLLFIVLGLPPLLLLTGLEEGSSWRPSPFLLDHVQAGVLFLAAYLLGGLGEKKSIPAAHIFAGMLLSGSTHATGLLVGTFPRPLLNLGFVVTGSVIGSRFSGVTWRDLRAFLGAAVLTIVVAIALSATAAWLLARTLDIPFGQAWVAYAPGGVEAMAAMAFALGYDPAFVATHHLFRILLLTLTVPILLRLAHEKPP
ncbi:MAG: AbrB family transcriptional regulator [Magnetococcales bacterium]|nr:AbrB family transcriptional regulator [Magnetococcales bacterium]